MRGEVGTRPVMDHFPLHLRCSEYKNVTTLTIKTQLSMYKV